MNTTAIEWSDKTWNPVTGCTPISEACDHCYAKRMATRLKGRYGYPADEPFRVTEHLDRLAEPSRINKPSRIFVVSMGDLFHEAVRFEFIREVIWQAKVHCQHTYMILTKRPERMRYFFTEYLDSSWQLRDYPIWLGVTAEYQQRADERIPILLDIPAAVHFVSVEPMLGPVNLASVVLKDGDSLGPSLYSNGAGAGLNWVICGAETGPGKRPMDWQWAKDLQEDCHDAGVPFFGKKFTDGSPILWRCFPQGAQP
jgi:protein gp37